MHIQYLVYLFPFWKSSKIIVLKCTHIYGCTRWSAYFTRRAHATHLNPYFSSARNRQSERDHDIYAGFWNSFHLSDQKEQHIESWVNCFGGFYCWLLPITLLKIVQVHVRAVTFLLQDFDRACEGSDKTAALHIFKHLILSHIAMHCIFSHIAKLKHLMFS